MTTAFVLSGGGNLGAVQVGMLQALIPQPDPGPHRPRLRDDLDLIDGLIQSVGESTLRAALTPAPNRCCVTLTNSTGAG